MPRCSVIDDVIIMKNTFWGKTLDDIFKSEVLLKLYFIFQNFQNGRHFELTIIFFTGSDTGS